MGILLDALSSVDFLAAAPKEAQVRFMVLGRGHCHRKRDIVWKAECADRRLIVAVTGKLKCVIRGEDGREFVAQFVEPGQHVGLSECLDGTEHIADVVVTRKGEFLSITADALARFLREWPECAAPMRAVVSDQRVALERQLADVVLRPLAARFAGLLLDHACVRRDAGARVLLDVPQADLAARLGTVREVVARCLGRFEREGLVHRSPDGITILDWDGLQRRAGVAGSEGLGESRGSEAGCREHTERYFLPLGERGYGVGHAENCASAIGSLERCVGAGCPAALRRARMPRAKGACCA